MTETLNELRKAQMRYNDTHGTNVILYRHYSLTNEGKRRGKVGFLFGPELDDLYEGLDYVSGIAGIYLESARKNLRGISKWEDYERRWKK